jgi:hypothetical protein
VFNPSQPPAGLRLLLIIMPTKSFIVIALATLGQGRFGQEGLVQEKIQALSNFGPPGAAGTLAGQTAGVLLAGANACAKVLRPNIKLDIKTND